MLANKIFIVGTFKRTAAGFPHLKDVKPEKGSYVSTSINYFVFHDRKVMCFAMNVFPKQMGSKVDRKSKCCWLRIFYQSWNYAVNNTVQTRSHVDLSGGVCCLVRVSAISV